MDMQRAAKAAFAAILATAVSASAKSNQPETREKQEPAPLNAVVKIEVDTAKSNIFRPWISISDANTGSGAVIGHGRILTCAHCVTDASFIRVRKHNDDTPYKADVLFIDNDADLALVEVKDPKFMDGVAPLEIGDTPHVQDDVLAIGYPLGGYDISYTRGIVSRIEDIRYTHSWLFLLGVQVDAAINPGNSGGPVLDMQSGKIAGIAFQGLGKKEGESLGYIIPPDIIRHFLKDIEDGKVGGFPGALFSIDYMENAAKRRYYRMEPEMTGVVVDHVDSAIDKSSVRNDDILLEIDGYKLSNAGRIRLGNGEMRSILYPIYMRQVGEKIPVKVLRKGKIVETSVVATKNRLGIKGWMYDKRPDYLVYGGLVFTTVSYDYAVTSSITLNNDIFKSKGSADEEPVVISFLFSDEANEGYPGCTGALVKKVNGVKVRNLRHLAELLDKSRKGFVCIDLDKNAGYDSKMILDAKKMRKATSRVMKRNMIPADRSEALRK